MARHRLATPSFLLFELLLCLTIAGLLSTLAFKTLRTKSIAITEASLHIQKLQKELTKLAYESYLNKELLSDSKIYGLIQKAGVKTNKFSFTQRPGAGFILSIGKEKTTFRLDKKAGRIYALTCNPSHGLCRQIYNRKQPK